MRPSTRRLLSVSICTFFVLPAVNAAESAPATPAPQAVTLEWNARLRHESVDDDAFARQAQATTLRVRLAARARLGGGWSALVESEGVAAGGDDYNSGANGRGAYPVVADPSGVELNQAWLGWRGERGAATLGRQRVLLDNQRWVGNVGWRQNEQTFDAAALEFKPTSALTARYFWLDRVHRVNGDDALDPLARERDLDTHVLDVALAGSGAQWSGQQLAGYAIAHKDQDVASASTLTTGVRWTGRRARDSSSAVTQWGWRVEAARQRDHAGNPLDFAHDYWLLEPSLTTHGITARAGWEHLGGDGRHALQTPLATLHAFNGWADKFLVTPAGGLEDRYVGAGGKFGRGAHAGKFNWATSWHDYRADSGGRYGHEWDASVGFPVHGPVTGLVKVADYRSDGYTRDTTKFWLQFEWARP